MDDRREQALSFGPAAGLYDSVRPSYPRASVDWALAPLGPGPARVVDIGAGTGIMTRLLRAAGHEVIAVEPDPMMRARLTEAAPDVTALPGSAEAMPLDEASIDGAVAAQAYHWFDHDRAHAELARVLRPGGVFAAIWNRRDESVAWVREYSRIVSRHPDDDYVVDSYGASFEPVERAIFRHSTWHTPESLVRLMQSRSYYLRASEARQRELMQGIFDLARTHPDLTGRSEFELPYETLVVRAIRRV